MAQTVLTSTAPSGFWDDFVRSSGSEDSSEVNSEPIFWQKTTCDCEWFLSNNSDQSSTTSSNLEAKEPSPSLKRWMLSTAVLCQLIFWETTNKMVHLVCFCGWKETEGIHRLKCSNNCKNETTHEFGTTSKTQDTFEQTKHLPFGN